MLEKKIIDGKKVAEILENEVKKKINKLIEKTSAEPGLATILVGDDPGSRIYVNIKGKACARVGINSEIINLPEEINEKNLLEEIDKLNKDSKIHGILVQLPLPPQIELIKVFSALDPKKDVDCFHPINFGKLLIGKEDLLPCTPKGIIQLLDHYNIAIEGKDTVIVNHSTILGKPLALMLLNRNATVTVAHIKTRDLGAVTKTADILIVGAGKPNLIKYNMIKEGCVIIDAGISRDRGKIVGDVDFEGVINKVRAITPVPGGVGPMTVSSLLQNTIVCFMGLIGTDF